MKTSLLSLFAGAVFLAGSAIASAGEPMTLTSAELDVVTAGYQSNFAVIDISVYQNARASASVVFGDDATASASNSSYISISQSNND
jgi:hypothetical protein